MGFHKSSVGAGIEPHKKTRLGNGAGHCVEELEWIEVSVGHVFEVNAKIDIMLQIRNTIVALGTRGGERPGSDPQRKQPQGQKRENDHGCQSFTAAGVASKARVHTMFETARVGEDVERNEDGNSAGACAGRLDDGGGLWCRIRDGRTQRGRALRLRDRCTRHRLENYTTC